MLDFVLNKSIICSISMDSIHLNNYHNHNHNKNCSHHHRHHHHRHNHHHYHHPAAAHAGHCALTPIFHSSRAQCLKHRIPTHNKSLHHHEPLMRDRTIQTPSPTSPITGHIASLQTPNIGRRRHRSVSNERLRNESRRKTAFRDDNRNNSENKNIEIHHYHHSNLNSVKESCSLM